MKNVIDPFFHLYFDSLVWQQQTHWLGHPVLKCPLDLFLYQEILFEVRPDVIIECGTYRGGSAYFLASMCDLLMKGRILSIDKHAHEPRPQHHRITYMIGDSASPEMLQQVKSLILPGEVVLVILDSDHSEQHVLGEMQNFNQLVTVGSYMIVEDTCVGHPVLPELLPGPMEAVQKFMSQTDHFVIDTSKHKFHMTFNPNGYLRRMK
ncbi:CmcI family methyltransferase [Paenibacillus sp. MBLB4367]|uniref:CmcI family methyltransferase n=1 Tax=Paenibacillus sp. MBLB4367 TaxID=3384767 RepID=UPI0039083730